MISERVISFFGLFCMLGFAALLGRNHRHIRPRIIVSGVLLQFAMAFVILKTQTGRDFFVRAQDLVNTLIGLSDKGAIFIFGDNFAEHFFAFKVLPTIIFVSSVSAILFHWGIMQRVVSGFAVVMQKLLGLSGSESLVAIANIFSGQTEAPLVVKPYLLNMTTSELMVVMISGMASVAGGVLAAYVGMGIPAGHLLAASLMSAPASIAIAKLMEPETQVSETSNSATIAISKQDTNTLEAACRGAAEGLSMALNVAAMLIAFVALVALVNLMVSHTAGLFGWEITLQKILGFVFFPVAWLLGVSSQDSLLIGELIGERMALNEFIAYAHLSELAKDGLITERSFKIATYALCGFANFTSIAIQIGGIGAIVPERKEDLARLGLRAMLGGTLATFMTACIAGILL